MKWAVPTAGGVGPLIIGLVCLTSCAEPSCAGPEQEAPHVAVNGNAWLAAHPGATLRACLGRACSQVTRTAPGTDGVHLYPDDSTDRRVTLRVVGQRDNDTVLNVSSIITLHRQHLVTGPCGSVYEVRARVSVTAAGDIDTH